MRTATKRLLSCVLVAMSLVAEPIVAQQGIEPMVIVPDHPQGVPINGCFQATRPLFGPYRFSFCLTRRGTYSVRGPGTRCDGRLTWHARGRDIDINIQRTSCNRGVAWERATMDCRSSGRIGGRLGAFFMSGLRCTYFPEVRGWSRETFNARRI